MASLYLSAAHKSSGKTTLSIGLCAALARRGMKVQPFKKGPDYIDPAWLGLASNNPCYNLDFFIAGEQETIDDYCLRSQQADIAIIEGNKGLHDGLDLDGSNSNAAMAKALKTPVIMVVDARGTMRGIAPLLIGYQVFDPEVRIAGVIANRTGGSRHESKLRAAVEHYTDIPFLGAIENNPALELNERHLGLIPGYEEYGATQKINKLADVVEAQIDLQQLLEVAASAGEITAATSPLLTKPRFKGLKIGIAQDRAFGFYYPGDLEAMRQAGAEIITINTFNDRALPQIDGLFIGGGFPERHAAALMANRELRQSIKQAIDGGLPTYAECGGLMYLSEKLHWLGESYDMVGAIPAVSRMHEKPCGRGYVKLSEAEQHPWPFPGMQTIQAHEFHYSSLDGLPADSDFAYQVIRGKGIRGQQDGYQRGNLLASYAHLRNTTTTPWVNRFLQFVSSKKSSSSNPVATAL